MLGIILRRSSFLGIERLVRTVRCRALSISKVFGDDTLHDFTERVVLDATRQAIYGVLRRVKRGKAFDHAARIGLVIDGVTSGHSVKRCCPLCRPKYNANHQITGYVHSAAVISVTGTGLTLPFDAELYGPGDSEYAAGQRLLLRALPELGRRYAQYLVVDGGYATAPFLHVADHAGIAVVARLKENLPVLLTAARTRFGPRAPQMVCDEDGTKVELWDAENFEPWETLAWTRVRVIRYRETKPNGEVIDAYWLTNIPLSTMGSRGLYRACKSRWEIENQVFNDAKNQYNLNLIRHHEANSVKFMWLMTLFAMIVERLYRLRYLHRGTHAPHTAMDLCVILWANMTGARSPNSS